MHDRDLDGPPVPFTAPKTRTLRCGCRQRHSLVMVAHLGTVPHGAREWLTITRCRSHDLLDDLGHYWRWARGNEWLKLAVCGLTSAALTYLVFGGS